MIIGKFICDKIECPLNTERCVVSKEKDPKDDIILVRSNICYSKTGDELQKSVTTETVNPNSQINVLIESYRSGGIRSINSIMSEDFDEEAFAAEMDAFQKNLNRDMDDLEKELQQMNYELVHMFD